MTAFDAPQPPHSGSSPAVNVFPETVTLLPPPPQPAPHPSEVGRSAGFLIRFLESMLALGAVGLAFLLALLPARNSDVWLHLASGRLLSRGEYHFGVDPFSYTTGGVYWVNSSWLYDLLSFFLFQMGEGTALVLAKAVLMALLGWLLIRAGGTTTEREKTGNGWIAVIFAVFALLIVGSSMPLRPICVSYVFLALTVGLLERRLAQEAPVSLASWWPVLLLFALWANLDAWFFLGPLTVGLYFLGALLADRERKRARILGVVLVAGLAVCLLNPHTYRLFAFPSLAPFTNEASILRDDPFFSRFGQSPLQKDFLRFQTIPHLGRLLYYPLVFVGLASFGLNALGARSGDDRAFAICLRRLPAWLLFLALSALDASTIPFLAIVAAPLTALNIQEYLQRRRSKHSLVPAAVLPWGIGGQILMLTAVLCLLLAAWPGWLQGQLRAPRGWFVEQDASLADAVRQVAQWRHDGKLLPTETGFNFSPPAAHYLAWLSSAEKSFCDTRWRLCSGVAGDYVTVRRALLGDASALDSARRILRQNHVAYLVLHDSDMQSTAPVFQRLVTSPGEWTLLFLKGDSVIFGWHDPVQGAVANRFADWRLDFHRHAFLPGEGEQAPAHGVGIERDPSDWRSFWTSANPTPSHVRDEAALYLIYSDLLSLSFVNSHRIAWEHGLAAGIVASGLGLASFPSQFLDAAVLQVSQLGPRPRPDGSMRPLDAAAMSLTESYDLNRDDGPPSLALLAVRAARRAVNEDANDARAYQLLGEAYLHLSHSTRERAWKNDLPSLTQIRQIQTAFALHRALRLQPDLIQAHTDLYVLYRDMGLLDLAVQHLRQVLRLTPTPGKVSSESRDSQRERLRQLNQEVEAFAAEIRRREDRFENQAAHGSVLERAVRALDNGLGGKALEILLASDVAVFGKQGTQMELDLLITVGRIDDAREWMAPSLEAELGSDAYHRLRLKLEAAAGDYRACEEELAQLASASDRPMTMVFQAQKFSHRTTSEAPASDVQPPIAYRLSVLPQQAACFKFGRVLLDAPWQKQSISQLLTNRLQTTELLEHLTLLASKIRRQAEVQALRGALALERGEVPAAESTLRRAAGMGQSAAQGMLDWLTEKAEPRP